MKHNNDIDLNRLLGQIDRYFDCSLSDNEEEELRSIIASTTLSHPAIDEARALMGFRAPQSRKKRSTVNGPAMRSIISIAAAVAIIFTLCLTMIQPSNITESTCIAYVNGSCITDENDIIRLIAADMRDFSEGASEADQSFRDELGDVAPIIDDYQSDSQFPEI